MAIMNRISPLVFLTMATCTSFAFIEWKFLPDKDFGIQTLLEGKWKFENEVSNWGIKKPDKSPITNIVLEFKKDSLLSYKDNRIRRRQKYSISVDPASLKSFKISFYDSKIEWFCDFTNGLLRYREVTEPKIICPVTIYYFKKLEVKLRPVF